MQEEHGHSKGEKGEVFGEVVLSLFSGRACPATEVEGTK